MSDNPETPKEEQDEDLWAAALQEQAIAEAASMGQVAEQVAPEDTINLGGAGQMLEAYSPPDLAAPRDIDIILDITVQLTVELGRTKISIRNLLQLAHGSVVELDGIAGEPMNVYVNGTLIAQGEVVVVQDKFGIRITDILTPADRIKRLQQ